MHRAMFFPISTHRSVASTKCFLVLLDFKPWSSIAVKSVLFFSKFLFFPPSSVFFGTFYANFTNRKGCQHGVFLFCALAIDYNWFLHVSTHFQLTFRWRNLQNIEIRLDSVCIGQLMVSMSHGPTDFISPNYMWADFSLAFEHASIC